MAILDDYQGVALSYGAWGGLDVTPFREHIADEEALVATLEPYAAVLVMRERTPLPGRVLRRLPRLKLIVTSGAGNASIDVAAARELGVTVCGTGGRGGADSTAELTWALMLALARRVPVQDAAIRSGGWQDGVGVMLAGRTLGIVGLGRIGSSLVPVAHAFGMRVTAWSRNLTPERAAEVGAEYVPREELYATADFVTVHLKLTPESRGYVTRQDLFRMKPTAFFVNTSRAGLVDTGALIEALRDHRIAGAGLDVFDIEPLPADDPLRTLPNTVLTPHVGYVTDETYADFYPQMAEDVRAYLAGSPIREIP
ncbi:MAG: D-2-hydroxyacid dehydrogenase family protein [Streptosporangiales bacterium]|nr:D-2-hydroxyacid dehydrogenase family protein [Streptosporangiales bacterium]